MASAPDVPGSDLATNGDAASGQPAELGGDQLSKARSDDEIAHTLRERYARSEFFTFIGPSVLLAVNPFGAETTPPKDAYNLESVCNGSGSPHPYAIASSAYLHMVRAAEDQVILTSGESGSGKSEVLGQALQQLIHLSKQTNPDAQIYKEVAAVETVLKCFGNAQTVQNANSTRYSRYTELKFNDEGTLVGERIVEYLFESTRVSQCPTEEKNFHVFYMLLTSMSREEKAKFKLQGDTKSFAYLHSGRRSSTPLPQVNLPSFAELRSAMRTIGFTKKVQSEIFRLLSGILHLGNIEFMEEQKKEDGAFVKNRSVLEKTAELLGVQPDKLEAALTTATCLLGDTVCSTFLNIPKSVEARNNLASMLYQILFKWIIEHVNTHLGSSRLGAGNFVNQIGLLDVAGFEDRSPKANGFDQFLGNYANEKLQHYVLQQNISAVPDSLVQDEIVLFDSPVLRVESPLLAFLEGPDNGLFQMIDRETLRPNESGKDTSILVTMQNLCQSHSDVHELCPDGWNAFKIRHYGSRSAMYDVTGFVQKNRNNMYADVINLFGVTAAADRGTSRPRSFVAGLFTDAVVETINLPGNKHAVVGARPAAPLRPSTMSDRPVDHSRKKSSMLLSAASVHMPGTAPGIRGAATAADGAGVGGTTSLGRLRTALDELLEAMGGMRSWSVLCVKPNAEQVLGSFDAAKVKAQVAALRVKDIVEASRLRYSVGIEYASFISRFGTSDENEEPPAEGQAASAELLPEADGGEPSSATAVIVDTKEKSEAILKSKGVQSRCYLLGKTRVFLEENAWRTLELDVDTQQGDACEERRIRMTLLADGSMRAVNKKSLDHLARSGQALNKDPNSVAIVVDKSLEQPGEATKDEEEEDDESPKARGCCGLRRRRPKPKEPSEPPRVRERMSRNRRIWVTYTWLVTWWIPDCVLVSIGKKSEGVRMAWREKVALCFIVGLLSGVMLFFVQGFGKLLCPVQAYFTASEVAQRNNLADRSLFVSFHGYVYDIYSFSHPSVSIVGAAGSDVSAWFPRTDPNTQVPLWPSCGFISVNQNFAGLNRRSFTWDNATNTKCSSSSLPNTPGYCHDTWATASMIKNNNINVYQVGYLAMSTSDVKAHSSNKDGLVIINNKIYNFTALFMPNSIYTLNSSVASVAQLGVPGGDASVNSTLLAGAMDCFDHLFLVGFLDLRSSNLQCNASAYILYGATGVMVAVMLVKFLAALQLAPVANPEKNDRFVIMQVPCYNEGEASLLKTIESLATLEYDDTRKLLFVVADGMIKSAGSDISTPDMVLKILGVDKAVQQPEAKSYLAIGRGLKEHNKAKVYSGLYSVQARYVPFLVVVKVGKEGETEKPGNRGKRDSQMILMKFLNRVNFGSPMTPLELEMYYHIKNVIGVDPFLYEYVLMVDADTKVEGQSLNRLISAMVHDANIMGICGETQIENEKESWVTMMQVYEYYISHHMAKAFESLFGSVTCLPGCFCMYRLRTPKKVPLLIANQILSEYQDINVNTLHKQNLLSLGEDRFLTTLMLKHFPEYRNKFTPDAVCYTIVPDSFQMLLGQRRRWINSTIHNLFELVFLPNLCGCLCFSMRLVVFLDLFATMVMPASTAYLGYLIYASVAAQQAPLISLIMLGAAYGLQAIIFIIKHQYQHIGWMIISILAMPVFSFYLPLYAYWHFDDFKWGNTRKGAAAETGDAGHGGVDPELEAFDPTTVPRLTWDEFEAQQAKLELRNGGGGGAALKDVLVSHSIESTAVSEGLVGLPTGAASPLALASLYGGISTGAFGLPPPMLLSPVSPPLLGYGAAGVMAGMAVGQAVVAADSTASASTGAGSAESAFAAGLAAQVLSRPWRGGEPAPEDLALYVRCLMATTDLGQLSKRKVREAAAAYFGVDLAPRKEEVNGLIETFLQSN